MDTAGTPPGGAGPGFDVTVAHSARVHDYWLGGKNHYAADRELAETVLAAVPQQRRHARANRDLMVRAVDHVVRAEGVRQIIDVGAGLPTSPNVHEIAHAAAPDTRVLYVDNDPIVMTHVRALMPTTGTAASLGFLDADLRDPDALLDGVERGGLVDPSRPVAVLLLAVLPLLTDREDPHGVVDRLVRRLAPGSLLVLTHATADFAPVEAGEHAFAAHAAGMPFTPRGHGDVERFLRGLDLVEPGIVPVSAWRPRTPGPSEASGAHLYAGVGRVRRVTGRRGSG